MSKSRNFAVIIILLLSVSLLLSSQNFVKATSLTTDQATWNLANLSQGGTEFENTTFFHNSYATVSFNLTFTNAQMTNLTTNSFYVFFIYLKNSYSTADDLYVIFSYNGAAWDSGVYFYATTLQGSFDNVSAVPFHNMIFTYSASSYNCTIDGHSGFSGTLDYAMSFNAFEFNSNYMTFTGGSASLDVSGQSNPTYFVPTNDATHYIVPFYSFGEPFSNNDPTQSNYTAMSIRSFKTNGDIELTDNMFPTPSRSLIITDASLSGIVTKSQLSAYNYLEFYGGGGIGRPSDGGIYQHRAGDPYPTEIVPVDGGMAFDGLNLTLTATSLTITSNGANASYVFTAFQPDSMKTVLFSLLQPNMGWGYPYTGQLNVVLDGNVAHSGGGGGGTIATPSPTNTPQPTQVQSSSNPTTLNRPKTNNWWSIIPFVAAGIIGASILAVKSMKPKRRRH